MLSIGEGDASRIYRTIDGGRHWTTAFVNDDPNAFYDCMDFFAGGKRGLALSDPVDGKFRIAATDDWRPQLARAARPPGCRPRSPASSRFAASGTCLVTSGGATPGSPAAAAPRACSTRATAAGPGRSTAAPIPAAEAGGVFSLAFRNPREGVMVGGDFTRARQRRRRVRLHPRRRRSWQQGGDLSGYRSGVDWVSGSRARR